MVFFLAPVAVAGYMLYQKRKKEEEELEGETEQDTNKLARDSAVDETASSTHISSESTAVHQQVVVAVESCGLSFENASTTTVAASSTTSENACPHDNIATVATTSVTQQRASSRSQLLDNDLQEKMRNVTNTWAAKFQSFCDDWENEIAEARSRNIIR